MADFLRGRGRETCGYALVFSVAVIPRILLAMFFPYASLDWPIVYSVVAENILRNHCVSQSQPLTGLCAHHWGGNQLPGFPAFAALGWAVSGHRDAAILIAQSVLTGIAIVWLTRAAQKLTGSAHIALGIGIVTAISPLEIGWSRSLNTEALAIAATIWVIAELMLSLAENRLRVLTLGIALGCAVFIRTDNVLLCVPVAVCGFAIHGPKEALYRGAGVAMILAIPLAAWTARSVSEGLPFPPTMNVVASINPDGNVRYPDGFRRYGLSWVANSTDMTNFVMVGYNGNYAHLDVPGWVFDTEAERIAVLASIKTLRKMSGKPIPPDIDRTFGKLAAERYERDPNRQAIWLPLQRIKSMWLNPFYSWGLPIGFERSVSIALEEKIRQGGARGMMAVAMDNPVQAFGKAFANSYLALLVCMFVCLAFLTRKSPRQYLRTMFIMAGSIVVCRSFFMASLAAVETRYIVECMPAIETVVVLALAGVLKPWPASQDPDEYPLLRRADIGPIGVE